MSAARGSSAVGADRLRSVLVLVLAVLQIAAAGLTPLAGGPSTGAISDANNSPITPAGYAFAIWGLIYLASLAYAINQLRRTQLAAPVHRRTGWWMAAAFGCSTIWVPIFATRTLWLAQLVILVLVGTLAVAAIRAATTGPAASRNEQALVRLPITLYLGWALLAATAGFATTFRSLGMPADGGGVIAISILLLIAATAGCLLVVRRATALASFAFTAGWALVAVAVASSSAAVVVVALLALAAVVVALVVRTGRSQHKPVILLG